jgi:TPR repeat protein
MAASQGNTDAKYKLAIMYLDGQGMSQDFIRAYYLFKECSNLGYDNAINIFNIPINYSKCLDIDYRKVVAMFATVCNKEIDTLERNVGHLYSQSFMFICGGFLASFTEKPSLKILWYERAASKGNPTALYEFGIYYEDECKKTKSQDFTKAINYFKRAYTAGSIAATYKLATIYLHGCKVSQDLRKAFTLLNEASDMGHKEACDILNSFDINDEEGEHKAVKKMLEISAESGHVISQYSLGILASDTQSTYYNIK